MSKRDNSSGDNVYSVLYGYSAGNVQYYAAGNAYAYPSNSSNISANDTSWHQVTYTYDGSTFKSYKDGVLVNSVGIAPAVRRSLNQMTGTTSNAARSSGNGRCALVFSRGQADFRQTDSEFAGRVE